MSDFDRQAALYAAISAAQGEFPVISKSAKGQVRGKKDYRYADLPSILHAVTPILSKHGLAVVQFLGSHPDGILVNTQILHQDGGSMSGAFLFPFKGTDPHDIGRIVTYSRRYALMAALNICGEEDDDDINSVVEQGGKATGRVGKAPVHATKPLTKGQQYAISMQYLFEVHLDIRGDEFEKYLREATGDDTLKYLPGDTDLDAKACNALKKIGHRLQKLKDSKEIDLEKEAQETF